jgi:iron(III) transport system permease protein
MPIAYLARACTLRGSQVIERLAYLGYAIPPVSLALALVFFSLRSCRGCTRRLTILIAAYVISFLALAIGPIRSALMQVPPRLEEAARSLGRRPVRRRSSRRPSRSSAARGGGHGAGADGRDEGAAAHLPAGPDRLHTLAVRVFTRTSEGMMAEAAPFALAIVLFSSLFVGLLVSYEGRR